MKPLRVSIAAAVALILVMSGPSAPARGEPADNPVTHWNQIAVKALIALPGPAGGAPPVAQINMGMVQGAVYDAVNATEPRHHRPYLLKRRFSARASDEASVATAAYDVLHYIVSTAPASLLSAARATMLGSLATEYAASLEAIPDSPFKNQGIAAGEAAAAAMIAARQDDGRFGPSAWVPNSSVGHWQPLLNLAGAQILDPTPWVGDVRPFLLQSSSQFRTAGPPGLDSAEWADDFNEVKTLGAANSTVRTADQTSSARFWQSTPVATWNALARQLVDDPAYAVNVADSARLLAMTNLSAADASINCWNDKYYWDFWRPGNAIARAAEDGRSDTVDDPNWKALITAPYPEHPSGHLCTDSAHLRELELFFGTDEIAFDAITLNTFFAPGTTRHFDSLSDALEEITEARIWAGLHFRTADEQAQLLGRSVADYRAAHYFQPVG